MSYYVCYETDRFEYVDVYENEKYAQEYAEETVERGYMNVRVMSEDEFVAEGNKIKFNML